MALLECISHPQDGLTHLMWRFSLCLLLICWKLAVILRSSPSYCSVWSGWFCLVGVRCKTAILGVSSHSSSLAGFSLSQPPYGRHGSASIFLTNSLVLSEEGIVKMQRDWDRRPTCTCYFDAAFGVGVNGSVHVFISMQSHKFWVTWIVFIDITKHLQNILFASILSIVWTHVLHIF